MDKTDRQWSLATNITLPTLRASKVFADLALVPYNWQLHAKGNSNAFILSLNFSSGEYTNCISNCTEEHNVCICAKEPLLVAGTWTTKRRWSCSERRELASHVPVRSSALPHLHTKILNVFLSSHRGLLLLLLLHLYLTLGQCHLHKWETWIFLPIAFELCFLQVPVFANLRGCPEVIVTPVHRNIVFPWRWIKLDSRFRQLPQEPWKPRRPLEWRLRSAEGGVLGCMGSAVGGGVHGKQAVQWGVGGESPLQYTFIPSSERSLLERADDRMK